MSTQPALKPSVGAATSVETPAARPGKARSWRWTFGVAAVLIGVVLGAIAIAINWYVGKLLP